MFSKRLIELASLIPTHSTVVDIGCDHALLDIYLTINRHCKCTASDISENCLEKAKLNLKKFKLEKEIPLVLSDGLNNVEYNNSDYIVIAGMGTETILKILENCTADNIIVQTNTDIFDFRETITDNFIIENEKVVYDKKVFYVLMKLKRGKKKYNYSDYLIGPVIKKQKTGVYKKYKEYLFDKYSEIYNNLKNTSFSIEKMNKRLEIKAYLNMIKRYSK